MSKRAGGATHQLDPVALYWRLDRVRLDAELSWRAVAREIGVQSSTFTRLSKGQPPSVDALVSILVWMEMDEPLAGLIKEAPE